MDKDRKTYGVSLKTNNDADLRLIEWLEPMEHGGASKVIRLALIYYLDYLNGDNETVPAGTVQGLKDEITILKSQPSGTAIPDALLRLIERQNAIQERQAKALERLANTGIVAAAPQGEAVPMSIDDDREDPNDPLVLAMMGMDFNTAFSD